jgi:hypothetical protein
VVDVATLDRPSLGEGVEAISLGQPMFEGAGLRLKALARARKATAEIRGGAVRRGPHALEAEAIAFL